jgi:hypothetical protein
MLTFGISTPYFITTNGVATWSDYAAITTDDKSTQDGTAALTSTLLVGSGENTIYSHSTSNGFGSPINTYNPSQARNSTSRGTGRVLPATYTLPTTTWALRALTPQGTITIMLRS